MELESSMGRDQLAPAKKILTMLQPLEELMAPRTTRSSQSVCAAVGGWGSSADTEWG